MDTIMAETHTEKLRGGYILIALNQHFLNGDAYVMEDEVYTICKRVKPKFGYAEFQEDLRTLVGMGLICREGHRVYLRNTLRYEESAARSLAQLLPHNELPCPELPDVMMSKDGFPLTGEQREAVRMALSSRLSVILGGAGTGKSTLIRAISKSSRKQGAHVLCAPTGKAARNLTEHTGMHARTVHSALGVTPDEDFLAPVRWSDVEQVIVDEASMMSLGMLAGILSKVNSRCRVTLLGDPNQLLSVGSGNVLPDLLALGVPHVRLKENHRQNEATSDLWSNVVGFSTLRDGNDLVFGESFMLHRMSEWCVKQSIVEEAVARYKAGESVQVLSPYNSATELSVRKLNDAIRDQVNPAAPGKLSLGRHFRDGDKVIILNNDRERNCSNGDVGILRILSGEERNYWFRVELPDGRCPTWHSRSIPDDIALAYALTVHKSQGSEYDTILMPVTDGFSNMLYRNLIYTAISRARSKVILYGSRNALSVAIQKPARPRRSMLVAKTHMVMEDRAA